jgi:carbon monoxide dehydrogenase subunit G
MDMTGEYRIAAPRTKVWEGLNDPEILRQCIAGCEEIDKTSDTEFSAKVTAKVGPVKARFGGKVTLTDLDPPNGYTITGEGSGGAAGFAKGGAKVALIDDGAGTVLNYTVQANVGGKLAQIGSRLIDATARKMADDFFSKFAALMAGNEAAAIAGEAVLGATDFTGAEAVAVEPVLAERVAAAATNPASVPISTPPAASPPTDIGPTGSRPIGSTSAGGPGLAGLHPAVWIVGLVIIIGLLLAYFR